jgi:hypothetical protein
MRRLLEEREIAAEGIVAPGQGSAASAKQTGGGRGARAVTVNLAESPLSLAACARPSQRPGVCGG